LDKVTKLLLFGIMLGLWGMLLRPLYLPEPVYAGSEYSKVVILDQWGNPFSSRNPLPVVCDK
jgi:hypothetical protein